MRPRAPLPASTLPTTCSASSSQLDPGNLMTPNSMVFALALDPEVLDDHVRQQVLAHLLEPAARRVVGHVELDVLADAHVAHAGEAHAGQRLADRLPLRVEDALLQGHVDFYFHDSDPQVTGDPRQRVAGV